MGEREQGQRTDRRQVFLGRLVRGVTIVGGTVIVVGMVLALVGYLLGGDVGRSINDLGVTLAFVAFLVGLALLFSAYVVTEARWVLLLWPGGWFGGGDDGGGDLG
jgi:hypothetical protein